MQALANIATAGLFMAGLGTALGGVLALANRKLYVWEDPRIDEVEQMLPATNCGACGTAGCRPFAEALIKGEVDPGECTVSTDEERQQIADYLGVDVGEHEKRTARLACAGGSHVAHIRAHYDGLESCRAASLVSGGGKGCVWGCLGFGDCEVVCDYDAIVMDEHHVPVVIDALCTACGDCVDVCPRDLFSIHPVSHQLWVACNNKETGAAAEAECAVICDGCGRCAVDAPEGLVRMQDNLAVVDYDKNQLATRIAIERCPTGAIVWIDEKQGVQKGVKAKKIIRRQALPLG
jgi:Na+-translocating ferredoxin:NAD+ oxidoreductase RNF subunit RnfB